MDQEMQEYLALKAALKGGIRSAQGYTWRRPLREVIKTRVVKSVKDHPFIAGEILAGLGAVAGLVLVPTIGVALLAGGGALIGPLTAGAIEQGASGAEMVRRLGTEVKAIGMVVATLAMTILGVRVVFLGRS